MTASKTTISIGHLHLQCIAVLLIAFTGCTHTDTHDSEPEYATALLNQMWIADAMHFTHQFDNREAHCIIHAESADQNALYTWYMDESKKVYAAKIFDGSAEDYYYFDSGILNFSKHNPNPGDESVLIAYAQSKPYAFATGTRNEWMVKSDLESPVSPEQLAAFLAAKQATERREKLPSLAGRFIKPRESIKSSLGVREIKTYALNVLKGNDVRIELKSLNPLLFFTTKPDNGSSMERQSWKHRADHTGDMLISVFSAEPGAEADFELIVEKSGASN